MRKREPITTTADTDLIAEARNQDLKISDILDAALRERVNVISKEAHAEILRKFNSFRDLAERYRDFIDRKGLTNDWLKEQGAV